MNKPASEKPGRIKRLADNYFPLAFIALVLFTFSANAQDTTHLRQRQPVPYSWPGVEAVSSLTIPRDTFKLAVRDSGSYAFKGTLYQWSGHKWNPVAKKLTDSTFQIGADVMVIHSGLGSGTDSATNANYGLLKSVVGSIRLFVFDSATVFPQLRASIPAGGSPNTPVGSGFKIAIAGTNNVKSITASSGVIADSLTANVIGIKADTGFLTTNYLPNHPGVATLDTSTGINKRTGASGDTLILQTKTINGSSIVGTGNITITGTAIDPNAYLDVTRPPYNVTAGSNASLKVEQAMDSLSRANNGGRVIVPVPVTWGRPHVGSQKGPLLKSNIVLDFLGNKVTLIDDLPLVSTDFGADSVRKIITANVDSSTVNFQVTDTVGIRVGGDIYYRLQTATYDAGEPKYFGWRKVKAIPDATHITLDAPTGGNMTVGSTTILNRSLIYVKNLVRNATVQNVYFFNDGNVGAGHVAEAGVSIQGGMFIKVLNSRFSNPGGGMMGAQFCVGCEIRDCILDSAANTGNANYGRGVTLNECEKCVVWNVEFNNYQQTAIVHEANNPGSYIENCTFNNNYNDSPRVAITSLGSGNLPVRNSKFRGYKHLLYNPVLPTGSLILENTIVERGTPFIYYEGQGIVSGNLTIGDTSFYNRKWYTKKVLLSPSATYVTDSVPTGRWAKVYFGVDDTTGVRAVRFCRKCDFTDFSTDVSTQLIPGKIVPISLTDYFLLGYGMASNYINYNDNKGFLIATDATVPAGKYATLTVEYYERAGATNTKSQNGTPYEAPISSGGGATSLTNDVTGSISGSAIPATIASHAVTFNKQQQIAGLSIPGVTGNSTADMAAIPFLTDKFSLYREGNTLVTKLGDSSNLAAGHHTRGFYDGIYTNSHLGVLYNKNTWANLSDFTDSSSGATVSGSKIVFSGGASTYTKTLGINMPSALSKFKIVAKFILGTINGSNMGIGIGAKSMNGHVGIGTLGRTNFSTTGSNGWAVIDYDYNTVITNQSQNLSGITASTGDAIITTLERNLNNYYYTVFNQTTGATICKTSTTYGVLFNATTPPGTNNTVRYSIYNFGTNGFTLDSLAVTSTEATNANVMMGDSRMVGYGAGVPASTVPAQIAQSTDNVVVNSGGGDRVTEAIARMPEIILLRPKLLFIGPFSVNDFGSGQSLATVEANYATLIAAVVAAGIPYKILLPFYSLDASSLALTNYLKTTYPTKYIDTWTATKFPGSLQSDNVHLTADGYKAAASAILASGTLENASTTLDYVTAAAAPASQWTESGSDIYRSSGIVTVGAATGGLDFNVNRLGVNILSDHYVNSSYGNAAGTTGLLFGYQARGGVFAANFGNISFDTYNSGWAERVKIDSTGKFFVNNLSDGVGNKSVRYNTSTKEFTYGDTTSGGGSSQWTNNADTSIYFNTGNIGLGTTAPDAKLHSKQNNVDGAIDIKLENSAAGGTSKFGILAQLGTTGYGVTGWPSALVVEGAANGGISMSAFAGDFKVQTGTSRVTRFTINNAGIPFYSGMKAGTGTPSIIVHLPDSSIAQMPYPSGVSGTDTADIAGPGVTITRGAGTRTFTVDQTAINGTLVNITDADYTIAAGVSVVRLFTTSSTTRTITFPSAATYPNRRIRIKSVALSGTLSASFTSASNFFLSSSSVGTTVTTTISQTMEWQSDGTSWYLINL